MICLNSLIFTTLAIIPLKLAEAPGGDEEGEGRVMPGNHLFVSWIVRVGVAQ